jgi:hypothetical protein
MQAATGHWGSSFLHYFPKVDLLVFSFFSTFLYRKTNVFSIFRIFVPIQAGWPVDQPASQIELAWMAPKMQKMQKTSVFLYKNAEKREKQRFSYCFPSFPHFCREKPTFSAFSAFWSHPGKLDDLRGRGQTRADQGRPGQTRIFRVPEQTRSDQGTPDRGGPGLHFLHFWSHPGQLDLAGWLVHRPACLDGYKNAENAENVGFSI